MFMSSAVAAGDKHAYVETSFPVLDTDETQPVSGEIMDSLAKKMSEEDLLADDMPDPPLVGFAKISHHSQTYTRMQCSHAWVVYSEACMPVAGGLSMLGFRLDQRLYVLTDIFFLHVYMHAYVLPKHCVSEQSLNIRLHICACIYIAIIPELRHPELHRLPGVSNLQLDIKTRTRLRLSRVLAMARNNQSG